MNTIYVNCKKEAYSEQRQWIIGENKFEKIKVVIDRDLLSDYTATLKIKVNLSVYDFPLIMNAEKENAVSQLVEVDNSLTIGVGYIRAWVEFTKGDILGSTNSVVFEVDNVNTNAPVNPPTSEGLGGFTVDDISQVENNIAKLYTKSGYDKNTNKLVTESDLADEKDYIDEKIEQEVIDRNNAILVESTARQQADSLLNTSKANRVVIITDESTTVNGHTVPLLSEEQIEEANLGVLAGDNVIIGYDTMFFVVDNADTETLDRISFDYFGIMTLIYGADGSIEYTTSHLKEVFLSGTEGTLTQEQYDILLNESGLIKNGGKIYRYVEDGVNYRAFINLVSPTDTEIDYSVIYINTSEQAVNFKHWNKEEVIPPDISNKEDKSNKISEVQNPQSVTQYPNIKLLIDQINTRQTVKPNTVDYLIDQTTGKLNNVYSNAKVVEIGSYQYIYEDKVLPALPVDIARQVYTDDRAGIPQVLHWTLYGSENNLKVVSSDYVAGTYSLDVLVHNQYHCEYEWDDETTGRINPNVEGYLPKSKVKSTQSTTSGEVYDVTYINSVVGNIEIALDEIRGVTV